MRIQIHKKKEFSLVPKSGPTIQKGKRYKRDGPCVREGFVEGEKVRVIWITEDVESKTGYRQNKKSRDTDLIKVKDGKLTFTIPESHRLTSIVFEVLR